MPFSASDADRHFHGLSDKDKRQWAHVANAAREKAIKDGKSQKEADAAAIRQANGVIGKSADEVEWQQTFEIAKLDDTWHAVFGYANVSVNKLGEQIQDTQDDLIDPEDLEKTAYDFVLDFRETGEMHQGAAKGRLIDSVLLTPEKITAMFKTLLPDNLVQKITKSVGVRWWVGFQIPTDSFEKVRSGEFKMFSIQGTARRVQV